MFVLLEENNGFNDVTQFEMYEQVISEMQETNGDQRRRKNVDV